MSDVGEDALALLLLPSRLEDFVLAPHARQLLAIPRVVALEPSHVRTPRFMRDAAGLRQARRLRFPGLPRLAVLYHPAQYPLARGLLTQYQELELWYLPPERGTLEGPGADETRELLEFDELAREKATETLELGEDNEVQDKPLRERLQELEVISARAFIPVVAGSRWSRRR
jgi:hypothetical protein